MINLFRLKEEFEISNGYSEESIVYICLLSILTGILVIISKNPIVSVLWLIGLFFSVSIYLVMLGFTFIGLSYLLVYVGAVSILFLFILMLINIRISELLSDNNNGIPFMMLTSIFLYITLDNILPANNNEQGVYFSYLFSQMRKLIDYIFNNLVLTTYDSMDDNLYLATSHQWDINIHDISHIEAIGNLLYTNLFIWLIEASIILLLAMVGCIVVTIKQKPV